QEGGDNPADLARFIAVRARKVAGYRDERRHVEGVDPRVNCATQIRADVIEEVSRHNDCDEDGSRVVQVGIARFTRLFCTVLVACGSHHVVPVISSETLFSAIVSCSADPSSMLSSSLRSEPSEPSASSWLPPASSASGGAVS